MKSLEKIKLNNNKIKEILYVAFNNILQLKKLDLSQNKLRYLPCDFLNLITTKLENINLQKNELQEEDTCNNYYDVENRVKRQRTRANTSSENIDGLGKKTLRKNFLDKIKLDEAL